MTTHRNTFQSEGLFFITFTCNKWMPLFEDGNAYDIVYKQFEYLISEGFYIVGYVIMPNHLHFMIGITDKGKTINTIIGNTKRFMAYEIIKRLKELNKTIILEKLANDVPMLEKAKGKLHQVFEPSFDCKECYTLRFVKQKLDYIHNNPCSKTWNLADKNEDYEHSSARFYLKGEDTKVKLISYLNL